MEASLGYYVDGLGFEMKNSWIPDRAADKPDDRIRWCCLARDGVTIMFQEFLPEYRPKEKSGSGASVCAFSATTRSRSTASSNHAA
jgi:lactoylglutathione lyase